jgi:hypothetical protein
MQPLPQDNLGQEDINGTHDPPHYKPRSRNLLDVMYDALRQLLALPRVWDGKLRDGQSFCKDNAPRREPILRNQPKF